MRESARRFSQKLFGEGGVRLASTVFVLLLARHLGAEEFGRYSSALAFAAICIVFVDLGTNSILTREIARYPQKRAIIIDSSHFLKVAASLGSWLILLIMTYLLKFRPEQRFLTLCLGIVVIGQTLTEYFSALLSGIEEMGWEAILKISMRLFGLSFGFISLLMGKPLSTIVLAMAVGTVASYGVAVIIIKSRFKSFGIVFDPPFLKSLIYSCLPLFGSVLFWILYDSQDVLMLNYFHFPLRDIGWFSAAMKVIDVIRVYPVLMMGVFFPTLSKMHATDPAGFYSKQRRLLLFAAGSLILIAAITYVFAPVIIRLLYKDDFAPASNILRLLLPSLIGLGLNHVQMQLLIALNQERKLLVGAFITCACNLLLAWVLLPRMGVPGACYALLGSETVYFLFLRKVAAESL